MNGIKPQQIRTVYVIRHAKTAQGYPDKSRQLTDFGYEQTQALAAHLHSNGVAIEHIITSSAVRAQQTAAALINSGTCTTAKTTVIDALYEAYATCVIVNAIQQLPDAIRCCAVVGHNPLFAEFAHEYLHGGDKHSHIRPGSLQTYNLMLANWTDAFVDVAAITATSLQYIQPSETL